LSKTNKVTVGDATRKASVGGASYKAKNEYIYQPGFEKAGQLIDKVKGVKPTPAVASSNTFGLADDVSDQLDAAFG